MAMALAVLAIVCVAPSAAQTKEQPIVKSESAGQFGGLPILPSCATFAVERGNPMTGPSVLLIRAKSGCIVPWHWHTASEELMLVTGTAKIEMTGMSAQTVNKGGYVMLPAKHHHQFTCQSDCLFFNSIAGTFDIHYLDKSGKEIPVAQALSAMKETPGSQK